MVEQEAMAIGAIQLNKFLTPAFKKARSVADVVFTKNTDTFECPKKLYEDCNNLIRNTYTDYEKFSKGTRFENLVKVSEDKTGIHFDSKEITILGKLAQGVSYPFFNMWLDIVNSSVGKILKSQKLNKIAPQVQILQKITDIPLLAKRAKTVKAEELYNELFGFKVFHGDPKNKNASVIDYTSAQLSKGFNNYSSAQERALNRLLTGTVSALFVGNDFYNVSMYQTDNPDEAEKSGNKRFGQEMVRIGTSAFLTYSILSAFSKLTKNMGGAIFALVVAQTIPEFVSRLGASGMPLMPLSSESAKNFEFKSAFGGHLSNDNKAKKEDVAYSDKFIKTSYLKGGVDEFAQNVKQNASSDISFKAKESELSKEKREEKTPKKHVSFVDIIFGTFAAFIAGGVSLAILKNKSSVLKNIIKRMDAEYEGVKDAISKTSICKDKTAVYAFIDKVENSGNKELAEEFRKALIDRENQLTTVRASQGEGKSTEKSKTIAADFLYKYPFKFHDTTANKTKIDIGKEETAWKCLTAPFDYALTFIKAPYKIADSLICKITKKKGDKIGKEKNDTLDMLRKMYKAFEDDINVADFDKKFEDILRKSYNFETQKNFNPTDLAMFSRIFITVIGTYFFVNDFRNRILIDSKGQDVQRANEVTNERIGQKVFNLFTNTFWMSLFNNLFQGAYLKSLLGAIAIAGGTEVINESVLRLLIGVPITKQESKADIEDYEESAYTAPGPIGAWTRTFADATGKKPIGQRAQQ